jgi:hypothetical protein
MHWIFFTYGMKKIQRMAAGSRPTEILCKRLHTVLGRTA